MSLYILYTHACIIAGIKLQMELMVLFGTMTDDQLHFCEFIRKTGNGLAFRHIV